MQGLHRQVYAGRDGAAFPAAVGCNDVERRRRAGIDYDKRPWIGDMPAHSIDQAVGPGFGRLLYADFDTQVRVVADDIGRFMEIALGQLAQVEQGLRHDRRNDTVVDRLEIETMHVE